LNSVAICLSAPDHTREKITVTNTGQISVDSVGPGDMCYSVS
jgi:hypothetical protein